MDPICNTSNTTESAPIAGQEGATASSPMLEQPGTNVDSPISILPTEILLYTFHLLIMEAASSFKFVPGDYFGFRDILHRLRLVTRICSSWRAVAIDYADLWTWVAPSHWSPQWTKECAERSKGKPLNIYHGAFATAPGKDALLSDVLSSSSNRVRQLIITEFDEFWNSLPPHLLAHASTLESLSLDRTADSEPHPINMDDILCLPNLRRVIIHRFKLQWTTIKPFAATLLNTLRIRWCHQVFVDQLFVVLDSLPALQVLEVEDVQVDQGPEPTIKAPVKKVRLDRLTFLRVGAYIRNCLAFLPCVVVPPTTDVRILVLAEEMDPTFETLSRDLLKLCGFTDAPDMCHLGISVTAIEKPSVTFTRSNSAMPHSESTSVHTSIHMPWTAVHFRVGESDNPRLLLETLLPQVSAPKLEYLTWEIERLPDWASQDDYTGSDLIRGLVSNAPYVKNVAIQAGRQIHPYHSIFCELETAEQSDVGLSSGFKFLPSLTHLHLSGVSFGRRQQVDALHKILKCRQEAGVQLHRVSLAECFGLDTKIIEELKELGATDTVEWDGLET